VKYERQGSINATFTRTKVVKNFRLSIVHINQPTYQMLLAELWLLGLLGFMEPGKRRNKEARSS